MAQSYEKVESKTKEFILFLPRRSKFAIFDGKVTKKNNIINTIVRYLDFFLYICNQTYIITTKSYDSISFRYPHPIAHYLDDGL
jgi:hypothetical protein